MTITKEEFLSSIAVKAVKAGMFSILFGVPGIGKTSMILWLAKNHKVLLLAFEGEDSAGLLADKGLCPEVKQLPAITSLDQFSDYVDHICEFEQGTVDFVIVDTLTSLGALYKTYILDNLFGGDALKFGMYAKGKQACELHSDKIVNQFMRLKDRGINVVLLAHSENAKEENVEGLDYSKQTFSCEPALRNTVAAKADNILRIGMDIFVDDSQGSKGKAKSSNQRVLFTTATATSGCKNRIGCQPRYDLGSNAESGGKVLEELLTS